MGAKLTMADIKAGRSAKGAFTKATLAKWGVPWPPPKGWKRVLIRHGYFDASKLLAKERQEPTQPELTGEICGDDGTIIRVGCIRHKGSRWEGKYLPTVADIVQHCLGRQCEIQEEIRADDYVIGYTCIRPTVRVGEARESLYRYPGDDRMNPLTER